MNLLALHLKPNAMSNYSDLDYVDLEQVDIVENGLFRLCLSSVYCVLFIFGLMGNLWVLGTVLFVFKNIQRKSVQNVSIFVYILSLSIVDTMVLINLPLLVSDIYFTRWMFGEYLCKAYWIMESVNKLMSKFILAAMSFDRFLAVCKHNCTSMHFVRTRRGAAILVLALTAVVFALLYPVYTHATVISTEDIFSEEMDNGTYDDADSGVSEVFDRNPIMKCILEMNDVTIIYFTCYMFILGFCVPSMLIIYFYARILHRLYNHARCRDTHIPLRHVTRTTLLLILTFFVCWTPFWFTVMYKAFDRRREPTKDEIYAMYVVHVFVYLNSAVNWILYAFLNGNLKETKRLASNQKDGRQLRLGSLTKRKTYLKVDNHLDVDCGEHRNRLHTISSFLFHDSHNRNSNDTSMKTTTL